jgi:hypothetical protein
MSRQSEMVTSVTVSATIMAPAFRFHRPRRLSRHGFVSRALFGSRVRATEVISVKAYPGFDLVDNPHADFPTLNPAASPRNLRPRSEGVLKVRRKKSLIRESSRWRPRWRVRFLPDGCRTPNRLRRPNRDRCMCQAHHISDPNVFTRHYVAPPSQRGKRLKDAFVAGLASSWLEPQPRGPARIAFGQKDIAVGRPEDAVGAVEHRAAAA